MDLVAGAKRVVVTMFHTAKGEPKILEECTLPLTGKRCVHTIVTDMAYFDVTPNGLLLKEIAKDVTVEDVRKATGCPFEVAKDLKVMPVDL